MLLVENSPATILIAALAAASQGVYPPDLTDWSLWNSRMPNDGDQAIAIYDTGSKPDGRSHRSGRTVEHPSLQIRIRSADYPVAFQKALSLCSFLDSLSNLSVEILDEAGESTGNFALIQSATRYGGIISLGNEEDGKRQILTINTRLTLAEALHSPSSQTPFNFFDWPFAGYFTWTG